MKMRFSHILPLAATAFALWPSTLRASETNPGQQGRWAVYDVAPGVVRVWYEPSGVFGRESSVAVPEGRGKPVAAKDCGANGSEYDAGDLRIRIDAASSTFSVVRAGDGSVVVPPTKIETDASGKWSMTGTLAPEERIYGLGEDNRNGGRLNRRGTVRDLWAGQQISSGNVTAQYPIPLCISMDAALRASGVFLDNVWHARYDIGSSQPDRLRVEVDGGEIDLYVLAGSTLREVVDQYTGLTGRPSLPPLWVLGYWQSRCFYHNWDEIEEVSSTLRARGFPLDAMVIDSDWPQVRNDFVWEKRWFKGGTPAEHIAALNREGVRLVLSHGGPMIQQESSTFEDGWKLGAFATDGRGSPVECGYFGGKLLDVTSPGYNRWIWPQIERVTRDGVAGWWLDLTEPEGEPPQTVYHAGPAAKIHNEFSSLSAISFEGAMLDLNPNLRPWTLTRAGSAGMQRHHSSVWTGDIYSDYATLRAHVPEMLSSSLSGFAWWTCDTGGFMVGYYKNDPMGAHADLYERWFQFSAFSPILRAHKADGVCEPYQFGTAVEETCRNYLRLRYRLMPYLYSCAWEASRDGMPLTRAMILEFPGDAKAADAKGDQFMLGDWLLVAPVLGEGLRSRKVYFPAGKWYDFDTGVAYEGGRDWVVDAPQNRIPLAVREGAILPMAPDMLSTGEKPWDPLTLQLWPAKTASHFTLYRDDGSTFEYKNGDFTTTEIAMKASGDTVALSVRESNKKFAPRTYSIRMHLCREPVGATVAGHAVSFQWDEASRTLAFDFASGDDLAHEVLVTLKGPDLPERTAPLIQEQKTDASGEAASSVGAARPHFFPAPLLPGRIKAVNYDDGGEGVSFHSARPLAAQPLYRSDDIGILPTTDAGAGYVLGGLGNGDWVRYSLDCGTGGWFDLTLRVAGRGGKIRLTALDRTAAEIDLPDTAGEWRDLSVPNVYLNAGKLCLLLFVEKGGFSLNALSFERAANPPAFYPATAAARGGAIEIVRRSAGEDGGEVVRNLGRIGSSLVWSVVAPAPGRYFLRLSYANGNGGEVPLALCVGNAEPAAVSVPHSEGWATLDIPATLEGGANLVKLSGVDESRGSINLAGLELIGEK
jgi:alpha-glucosidase (family GH31 glycosyl hydrolase)